MTARAREVLVDCEHALTDFSASANTPFQRPRWVALITLLATVLDVLEKVDGMTSSRLGNRFTRPESDCLSASLSPLIFTTSSAERNHAVHLYG